MHLAKFREIHNISWNSMNVMVFNGKVRIFTKHYVLKHKGTAESTFSRKPIFGLQSQPFSAEVDFRLRNAKSWLFAKSAFSGKWSLDSDLIANRTNIEEISKISIDLDLIANRSQSGQVDVVLFHIYSGFGFDRKSKSNQNASCQRYPFQVIFTDSLRFATQTEI